MAVLTEYPLTLNDPVALRDPTTVKSLAMYTPPDTCNAPTPAFNEAFSVLLIINFPPTYASRPTPSPPRTCNAPVVVDNALVLLVTVVAPPTTNPPPMPAPPASCKAPVVVDIVALVPVITNVVNVALPAVTGVDTPVKLTLPVTVTSPPTYKFLPIPTPPYTTNAPELVDTDSVVAVLKTAVRLFVLVPATTILTCVPAPSVPITKSPSPGVELAPTMM